MVIKQKYSVVTSVAAYLILFGALLLGWLALQKLPIQIHSFKEPSLGSPIVFAQEPAEEQIPTQNIAENLSLQLQAGIDSFIADNGGGGFGIYILDMSSGAAAAYNADTPMMAASMYKLFVANEALKMVDEGKLLMEAVIDGARGLSLAQCLEKLITISDNNCGVILQRVTGAANTPLPQLDKQGLTNTDLRGYFPETSPRDLATLFKNLLEQSYLSEDSNQLLIDLLSNQKINNRLPQGLPDDAIVMHKTGDLKGFAHDGGIVRAIDGQEYILVIMTSPEAPGATLYQRYELIADLASSLHELITTAERQ